MGHRAGFGIGAVSLLGASIAALIGAYARTEGAAKEEQPSIAAAIAAVVSPQENPPPDLEIHEWGTFLGMNGSDGTSVDGMYHEEHALPSFVHARSRDQLRIPMSLLKGETPVIYFYTERPQSVRIGVGFPKGIWTQWYPQAAVVSPSVAKSAENPEHLINGRICWQAQIIPARIAEAQLKAMNARKADASTLTVENYYESDQIPAGEPPLVPETSSDALWNHARQVDAAYVRTVNGAVQPPRPEYERYLFYRGLGEAKLPLRLDASTGGTLTLDREPTIGEGVAHLFVVRVENGRASYRYIPSMKAGESLSNVIPSMQDSLSLEDYSKAIGDDLAARLTESGLFAKEARAMVNTWKTSYFQNEGVRVLFVLPQSWTDSFIPMSVVPKPKKIVRVMVGRLELLTKQRETLAEAAIQGLASDKEAKRAESFAYLQGQGRYVEPIVRRVLNSTKDETTKLLCRRLLLTDFVNELRASAHAASDGKMLMIDPIQQRAQLARLLREIGQNQEAKNEGLAVLKSLKETEAAAVGDRNPSQIQYSLEIKAAAIEATGVDRSAADTYRQCIATFVSTLDEQVHPAMLRWCKDWWVGQAYGRSLARAGELDRTIDELKAAIAGKESVPPKEIRLARLLLAYLYEVQGKTEAADGFWAMLKHESEETAVNNAESTALR